MGIKQKKLYLRFSLIVLIIAVLFFLIANTINLLTFDSNEILTLEKSDQNATEVNYIYSTSNINEISFVSQYSNGVEIDEDTLGTYKLNNSFNISNFNPFNLFNQLVGNYEDKGWIKLSLNSGENCVYLDCYSNQNSSKPTTISKINLHEDISFLDYKFNFISEKKLKDKNVYTLLEGTTENNSKVQIYLIYE